MLCSELELHDRCGEMLEPLTCLVCPDPIGEAAAANKSVVNVIAMSDSSDENLYRYLSLSGGRIRALPPPPSPPVGSTVS